MTTPFTLGRLLTWKAEHHPHRAAVVLERRTITHAEMLTRARRAASAFVTRSALQDRVAILSQNCPEYVEGIGGAALSGRILVTLNWRLAVPELIGILRDPNENPAFAPQPNALRLINGKMAKIGTASGRVARSARFRPVAAPPVSCSVFQTYAVAWTGLSRPSIEAQK